MFRFAGPHTFPIFRCSIQYVDLHYVGLAATTVLFVSHDTTEATPINHSTSHLCHYAKTRAHRGVYIPTVTDNNTPTYIHTHTHTEGTERAERITHSLSS